MDCKGGEYMEQLFYESNQICEILGCCPAHARKIMSQMPHFRLSQSHRSPLRVRVEDFNKFLDEHMVQPDEPQPRTSPYETTSQKAKREARNWHKQRKKA